MTADVQLLSRVKNKSKETDAQLLSLSSLGLIHQKCESIIQAKKKKNQNYDLKSVVRDGFEIAGSILVDSIDNPEMLDVIIKNLTEVALLLEKLCDKDNVKFIDSHNKPNELFANAVCEICSHVKVIANADKPTEHKDFDIKTAIVRVGINDIYIDYGFQIMESFSKHEVWRLGDALIGMGPHDHLTSPLRFELPAADDNTFNEIIKNEEEFEVLVPFLETLTQHMVFSTLFGKQSVFRLLKPEQHIDVLTAWGDCDELVNPEQHIDGMIDYGDSDNEPF